MSPFHNVLPWRQLTIVALSICLTLVTAGTVLAKTTTWTNAAPADDNWSTAGNWDNGVPTSGDQITFCNTGHWASLGWFVSSEIMGNKQTRMYDGSMVEWSADQSLPMQSAVSVQ